MTIHTPTGPEGELTKRGFRPLPATWKFAFIGIGAIVALAGCGASVDGGGSGDQSSRIVADIQSNGQTQLTSNASRVAADAKATLNDVSCVETGSTQAYNCIGHYTVDSASLGLHQKYLWTISATCDSGGSCQWHGDNGAPSN